MLKLLPMLKSWKSTTVGVLTALLVLFGEARDLLDDNSETVCDWEVVVLTLGVLGIGGAARDSDVTSEQAGAK